MKRRMKLIIGAVIIVILAGYIVYEAVKPVHVDFLRIMPGEVFRTFKEDGNVQAVVQREIYSLSTLKVVSLAVQEGQEVHAGDEIAVLDKRQLEGQLDMLNAQKDSAVQLKNKELKNLKNQIEQQTILIKDTKHQLEIAQKNYERTSALYNQSSVSSKELENTESAVKQLSNTLEQQTLTLEQLQRQFNNPESETAKYHQSSINVIQAQMDDIQAQINDSYITAPIDGTVINLNYNEGEIVSPQQPVCTIYEAGQYRVEAYILTEDAAVLEKGMSVEITQELAEEDMHFSGSIDFIEPAAVESISSLGLKEKRVKVHIKFDNPKNTVIYPGYSVKVEFTTFRGENLITIPKTSIFQVEGQDTVWVVENGRARYRPIKKGVSTDIDVVITEGLEDGETIITNPNIEGLQEGKAVADK